jgi:hypothetical protein
VQKLPLSYIQTYTKLNVLMKRAGPHVTIHNTEGCARGGRAVGARAAWSLAPPLQAAFVRSVWLGKERERNGMWQLFVLCNLVGGQNGQKKSWTKILAETLAPLLLGIDCSK